MTVHLLKNKTEDSDLNRIDLYQERVKDANFVPILRYVAVDFEAILETLEIQDFEAIIVTSQRAVDVLKDALAQCKNRDTILALPAYTVGPATADRLVSVGFRTVVGSETGNGQALATKMIQESSESSPQPRKFIFFAGEVHRPHLPQRLNANGLTVRTQIVYKTQAIDFLPGLKSSLKPGDWIVFFSPSFTQEILPLLTGLRVAAIGPTTRQHLEENGIQVDAMAEHPTAEGLDKALQEAGY